MENEASHQLDFREIWLSAQKALKTDNGLAVRKLWMLPMIFVVCGLLAESMAQLIKPI